MSQKEREEKRAERVRALELQLSGLRAESMKIMEEMAQIGVQFPPDQFVMTAIEVLIEQIARVTGGGEDRRLEIVLAVEGRWNEKLNGIDQEEVREKARRMETERLLLSGNVSPEQMEAMAKGLIDPGGLGTGG